MPLSPLKYYLSETEFYAYIKFYNLLFNSNFLKGKELFSLHQLHLKDYHDIHEAFSLIMGIQNIPQNMRISSDVPSEQEIKEIKKEIQQLENEEEKKAAKKILKKLNDGKSITLQEMSLMTWVWYEIYYKANFQPSNYKITSFKRSYKKQLNNYLDAFINDQLLIDRKNYFGFDAQKKLLVYLLEEKKMLRLYGNNFIIIEPIDDQGNIKEQKEFALIQTIFALEKLGYLEVLDLWETSHGEENHCIRINVIISAIFVEELNQKFQEDNPKLFFDKYDSNRKVLTIADKKITLAKKNKDTDSIRLLETLLKEPRERRWEDEILEDWGYREDETKTLPKNKVYFAKNNLNTIIKKAVNIDDFIEGSTREFNINPRYLKIEE